MLVDGVVQRVDTPWPEARRLSWASAAPLGLVERPLADAVGDVLACDVLAVSPLPPFAMSAMDGWAVAGAGPWHVVGARLAGPDPRGGTAPLRSGTALEVATGAPVPPGATAVLPYEDGAVIGGWLRGPQPVQGRHIRFEGEECVAGERLLAAGHRLRAAGAGLMAATGHDVALVRAVPRVAVVVTGDEVIGRGLPGAGLVRDAIGPVLPGLLAGYGAVCTGVSRVADTPAELRAALALTDAEVVVVSGSSSVGPADHLLRALSVLAADIVIHGVACRPGHPQVLARLADGRMLVGLPGNPLAALVAVVTLLEPLLAGLTGRPLPEPLDVDCPAQLRLGALPGVTRLQPARDSATGPEPLPYRRSAMLRGAALADGFLVLDQGAGAGYVRLPA